MLYPLSYEGWRLQSSGLPAGRGRGMVIGSAWPSAQIVTSRSVWVNWR